MGEDRKPGRIMEARPEETSNG
jgi:hypothetical protein